jgi:hypothetical protein
MKWAVPGSYGMDDMRSPRSAVAADVPDCAAADDAAAVVGAAAAGSQLAAPAPCDGVSSRAVVRAAAVQARADVAITQAMVHGPLVRASTRLLSSLPFRA